MSHVYSIGIIGGADGPTAIFVTGSFLPELVLLFVMCLGVFIWYRIKKE